MSDQGQFHFLVRTAGGEGDTRGSLHPVTLMHFDQGLYPNPELVAQAREILMERRGRRVSEVLAEIDRRRAEQPMRVHSLQSPPDEIEEHASPAFARMKRDGHTIRDDDDNPQFFGETKAAQDAHPRP